MFNIGFMQMIAEVEVNGRWHVKPFKDIRDGDIFRLRFPVTKQLKDGFWKAGGDAFLTCDGLWQVPVEDLKVYKGVKP